MRKVEKIKENTDAELADVIERQGQLLEGLYELGAEQPVKTATESRE